MTSSSQDAAAPVEMTSLQRAGEWLFKKRDYTPIPLGIVAILFANPNELSLGLGLAVALIGEAIRAYGVAFIGTISRTRSYSNGALITSGPFSVLRNPLYLGNLVLSLGISAASGIWWVPLATLIFFFSQYIPIVAWEEMKLTRIFGQEYTQYCEKVPHRWFPPFSVFVKYNWCISPDSWKPALRSEKRTLTAILFAFFLLFGLFLWNSLANKEILPLAHWLVFWK